MHPETIRCAIRSKRLACYRLNGSVRISPEQLAAYLADNFYRADETRSAIEPGISFRRANFTR